MKKILTIVAIFFLVICAGSGWIFNIVQDRNDAKEKELATLASSFTKQYGSDAVMNQLLSVDKVYTAYWSKPDGTPCASWCIGGIWVTVYIGQTPESNP